MRNTWERERGAATGVLPLESGSQLFQAGANPWGSPVSPQLTISLRWHFSPPFQLQRILSVSQLLGGLSGLRLCINNSVSFKCDQGLMRKSPAVGAEARQKVSGSGVSWGFGPKDSRCFPAPPPPMSLTMMLMTMLYGSSMRESTAGSLREGGDKVRRAVVLRSLLLGSC